MHVATFAVGKDGKATPPVRLVRLEGGGHSWPGSSIKARLIADQPFAWDASAAIVEFFAGLTPVRAEGAVPVGR